ncbi:hypothetical protein PpBr36_02793 [Pyricularia pennisetigena]|uniref:hypothetical protein n=1 Tax=Pyricularia pennisetigena TaxID=1578925 RepID=UPI00114F1640|nr:hypothetical protein PpBr36_02793 [Pyricularia pennisetigena]TLS30312.1 hypothetical protein PpBr36_02793 [Pyricularia pennisetigena]
MAQQAPVEPLVAVVPAPEVGLNVFTNEIPPWSPGKGVRGIFGGFLIAQAVRAAQLSTDASFAAHVLQSIFVRPGKATSQIYYHVERVADGRTFATRLVRTMQDGAVIFTATVGLQRQDPTGSSAASPSPLPFRNLEHALPPPDMDGKGPDDIPETSKDDLLSMVGFKTSASAPFIDDPFEWRHLLDQPGEETGQTTLLLPPSSSSSSPPSPPPPAPHSFRLRSYVRSSPLSPAAGPAEHLASLAFLTDEWLMALVNLAHPEMLSRRPRELLTIDPAEQVTTIRPPSIAVQASIHHNILFHDASVRADGWLISERLTSWAAEGRVLVEQRLWSLETGRLVLSSWQEGLVRLKGDSKL